MVKQGVITWNSIKSEGGLLPSDLLQRILRSESIPGMEPTDYGLDPNERIGDEINYAWTKLIARWETLKSTIERKKESDTTTSITRGQWLLPLFDILGYGRLPQKNVEFGRGVPISHKYNNFPIHLLGTRVPIHKRSPRIKGAATQAPHSLVQEFINQDEDSLWGIVSNGHLLRLLRDNRSITRPAYVEFDLQVMFEGQHFDEFRLLWLILHHSRLEGEDARECWLEKWFKLSKEQGVRALESLRIAVEGAIVHFGNGFVSHPSNESFRQQLRDGEITVKEFYRQLLRLIYRMIFLFVAEDRNLLFEQDAEEEARLRYEHYSTQRLRRLSLKRGGPHGDHWQGLLAIMLKLNHGYPDLALPALGSFLWREGAMSELEGIQISNGSFLAGIRTLTVTESEGIRRSINWELIDAEELGSVYEGLLEREPNVNTESGRFKFNLEIQAGNERKTTGSYYTPEALVNHLIGTTIDPLLAEAMKSDDKEESILSLTVCDPATGSGHFLLAAARRIAKQLARVRSEDAEPSPEATQDALRDVVSRCIYGVDLNDMAVELCKVGLWLEIVTPGAPLPFLDSKIKHGNSLIGQRINNVGIIHEDAISKSWSDARKLNKAEVRKRKKQGHKQTDETISNLEEEIAKLRGEADIVEESHEREMQQLRREINGLEQSIHSRASGLGSWTDLGDDDANVRLKDLKMRLTQLEERGPAKHDTSTEDGLKNARSVALARADELEEEIRTLQEAKKNEENITYNLAGIHLRPGLNKIATKRGELKLKRESNRTELKEKEDAYRQLELEDPGFQWAKEVLDATIAPWWWPEPPKDDEEMPANFTHPLMTQDIEDYALWLAHELGVQDEVVVEGYSSNIIGSSERYGYIRNITADIAGEQCFFHWELEFAEVFYQG